MKIESMERLLINFCKYCSDVFLKFKNRKNLFINYFWFLTLSPDIKPAHAILTNQFTTQVKRNQLFGDDFTDYVTQIRLKYTVQGNLL